MKLKLCWLEEPNQCKLNLINRSQAPYAVRNVRNGTRFGMDLKMEDTLSHGLVDSYPEKTPSEIIS